MQTKCEKVLNQFIAIVLIMMLTFADIIAIGVDFATYAIDMIATSSSNVEFEAYFKNQGGEKVTVTEAELDAGNLNLYVDISVKQEGYFNGKVMLQNSNFSITKVTQNSYVNSFDANSVTLNQINSGKTVTIEMQVKPNTSATMNVEILNKDTQVKLQGTYVSSNGSRETEGTTVVTAKFVSGNSIKSTLDAQVLTNKVYEIEGTNKRMVQILVKSKIDGNVYPVKKDTLSLNLPSDAESVEVTQRTTKATNPNVNFGNSNYSLNSEKNKLEINVENQQDQNGNISFEQNAKDEFVVTCVYAENKTFENIDLSDEEQKAPIEITQEILTYDEKTLTQNKKLNIETQVDGILNYELSEQENQIYKGKIYTGEERTYEQNIRTYVNSTKVQNNIAFSLEKTKYISGELKKESKITYKVITITKDEMTKVVGQDGFITIRGEDNTIISNITAETQANAEGYIVISIPENTYKIQIETSNVVNVGKIDFKVQKSIKEKDYTREEIKQFTAIEDKIIAKEEDITKQIELKETRTEAKFELNTTSIKSGENDNVQMKITLLANDESKDLYKNPKLKITFPKEANEINATYKMLYANGLEKESATLKEENGRKVLEIKLSGEQQTYPGEVIDGTEIIVNVSITMNSLMTSGKDVITLEYTNENATNIKDDGVLGREINVIQSQKLIVTNDIEELGVKTIGQEEDKKIELKASEEIKTATVKIKAINNEGETLENVKILGRFPTKGNSNTMDITLTSAINITSNTQGVTVYYSSKEDASEDLSVSSNGWSTDVNMENKRSYLIVVASLENAGKVEAEYGIRINQNVKESRVARESFEVVYSKNNSLEVNRVESCKVTIGCFYEKITVMMKSALISNDIKLTVGNIYKYILTITNNSSETFENIEVKIKQNQLLEISNFFSEEIPMDGILNIDKLEAGEEKNFNIYMKCRGKSNKEDKASIYAEVKNNYEIYSSNIVSKDIYDISTDATINSNIVNKDNERTASPGDIIDYEIEIRNTCVDDLQNLEIRSIMSRFLEIEGVELEGKEINFKDETLSDASSYRNISMKLDLNAKESKKIVIKAKVGKVSSVFDNIKITNFIQVVYDSAVIYTVSDKGFDFKLDNYIEYKDEAKDTIESTPISIKMIGNQNNDGVENGQITPQVIETTSSGYNDLEEKSIDTNLNEKTNEIGESKYKVTGNVWLDELSKGEKLVNYKKLEGIKVKLIEANTGEIVKDDNGNEILDQTNSNGEYKLSDIKEGKYVVVFEYDLNKYKPTEYQKEGVSDANNSDAILKDILVNGKTTNIVATDILTINKDFYNIDLGLVEKKSLDLELTKTVTKIIVSNDKETKEYRIEDKTLTKVEIAPKQLNKSKVTIEYSIKVKNTGDISGYVKSIVDYIPKDIEYNDADNLGWKEQGEYVYNTSLKNEEINPGETKEVKLILTKIMTESNTGLVSNIAEIQETQNVKNISDKDSTPGNRKDGEDDIGQADVIIGIKTGVMLRNILLIIYIIILVEVLNYLIVKNN